MDSSPRVDDIFFSKKMKGLFRWWFLLLLVLLFCCHWVVLLFVFLREIQSQCPKKSRFCGSERTSSSSVRHLTRPGSALALQPLCTCLGSRVQHLWVQTWGPSNTGCDSDKMTPLPRAWASSSETWTHLTKEHKQRA